ncbi:hypothetical protein I4U23_017315 [Adineta vaga]|nr:hypothetical protein I4U23_017315 [Adineta vaga]
MALIQKTHIYWAQTKPYRRYALTNTQHKVFNSIYDKNNKHISTLPVTLRASITFDHSNKIGTYACMAQDAEGNKASANVEISRLRFWYGAKHLSIVVPDVNDEDHVEIMCTGALLDHEDKIQWYFNNRLLTDEHPFQPRGEILRIDPVSKLQSGNYRCSINDPMYRPASSNLTLGEKSYEHVLPLFKPLSPLSINEVIW